MAEAQATAKGAKLEERQDVLRGRGSRASPWPTGGGGGRQARAGMAGRFVPYPARNSDQTFIHAAQPAMPSLSSLPPTRAPSGALPSFPLPQLRDVAWPACAGSPTPVSARLWSAFSSGQPTSPWRGWQAAGAPAARPPRRPSQGRDESPAQPPPSPLSPSFNRRRRLHPRRAKGGGLGARSSACFHLIGKGFGPGTVRESRPRGYLRGGSFGPVAVRVRRGRLHFTALL